MKKLTRLGLITIILAMALIIPVSAAKPEHRVTGSGWFTSGFAATNGDKCHFAFNAKQKPGEDWTGHGILKDMDSGVRVILTIDHGHFIDPDHLILTGESKVYVNNKLHAEWAFSMQVSTEQAYYLAFPFIPTHPTPGGVVGWSQLTPYSLDQGKITFK